MFGTNPPQTKEAPRVETNRSRTVSGRDAEMHAARDENRRLREVGARLRF